MKSIECSTSIKHVKACITNMKIQNMHLPDLVKQLFWLSQVPHQCESCWRRCERRFFLDNRLVFNRFVFFETNADSTWCFRSSVFFSSLITKICPNAVCFHRKLRGCLTRDLAFWKMLFKTKFLFKPWNFYEVKLNLQFWAWLKLKPKPKLYYSSASTNLAKREIPESGVQYISTECGNVPCLN